MRVTKNYIRNGRTASVQSVIEPKPKTNGPHHHHRHHQTIATNIQFNPIQHRTKKTRKSTQLLNSSQTHTILLKFIRDGSGFGSVDKTRTYHNKKCFEVKWKNIYLPIYPCSISIWVDLMNDEWRWFFVRLFILLYNTTYRMEFLRLRLRRDHPNQKI